MIGWCFCGSFCTLSKCISVAEEIAKCEEILPIFSIPVQSVSTRFGTPSEFSLRVENICGRKALRTISECEPIGPKNGLDALIIAPCTGNTLAKIASGITDSPVTMAAKAHLRNRKPLIIALASNDAMSANFKNLALLLERKNVYFVPMFQDDPVNKPSSLVADFSKIAETIEKAKTGEDMRPMFL